MLLSTILLAAEDMGPNPIAPEGKELFWGAGTFLVFLFVMRVFLVPKVRKGMEARYGMIRDGHESAQATRSAAQSDVAAYEAAIAEVRAEAAGRVEKARQTLDSERQAKVAEANARIAAKRADADKSLETARTAARVGFDVGTDGDTACGGSCSAISSGTSYVRTTTTCLLSRPENR